MFSLWDCNMQMKAYPMVICLYEIETNLESQRQKRTPVTTSVSKWPKKWQLPAKKKAQYLYISKSKFVNIVLKYLHNLESTFLFNTFFFTSPSTPLLPQQMAHRSPKDKSHANPGAFSNVLLCIWQVSLPFFSS